jgi:hypothetical protein
LTRDISEARLLEIVEEAFIAESGEYSTRKAQEWAKGYTFPPALLQKDLQEYRSAGSLQELCFNRQRAMQDGRLNLQRIFDTFGATGEKIPGLAQADFQHLITLASSGIELVVPEDFKPNLQPPALRTKYLLVQNAVNKLVADQVEGGTVLLLPIEEAVRIPGVHFSCQHWATNKGKVQGRIICDVANPADPSEVPLNGAGLAGKERVRIVVEEK